MGELSENCDDLRDSVAQVPNDSSTHRATFQTFDERLALCEQEMRDLRMHFQSPNDFEGRNGRHQLPTNIYVAPSESNSGDVHQQGQGQSAVQEVAEQDGQTVDALRHSLAQDDMSHLLGAKVAMLSDQVTDVVARLGKVESGFKHFQCEPRALPTQPMRCGCASTELQQRLFTIAARLEVFDNIRDRVAQLEAGLHELVQRLVALEQCAESVEDGVTQVQRDVEKMQKKECTANGSVELQEQVKCKLPGGLSDFVKESTEFPLETYIPAVGGRNYRSPEQVSDTSSGCLDVSVADSAELDKCDHVEEALTKVSRLFPDR